MPDSQDAPLHNRKRLKQRRQSLRNAATPAERALWTIVRKRQLGGRKFRRQHFLAENGFTVLRFANEQVFEQPDMVCAAIAQHVDDA
jgi:very-short-patch-repair endonuclease